MTPLVLAIAAALQTQPDAYISCLTTNADKFEASGESAEAVARSALEACVDLERSSSTLSPLVARGYMPERRARLEMRDALGDRLVLRVVRLRACRNTASCSVAALPQEL